MANNRPFTIKVNDKELKALMKTFNAMDKIAKNDMKTENKKIANDVASAIGSALMTTPQGAAIAQTIKVSTSYKQPIITIGEGDRTFSNGKPVAAAIMGIEFGAYQDRKRERKSGTYTGYRQFQPRSPRKGRGNAGYFIFPTLVAMHSEITKRWRTEVDRIQREWRERIN
jgi:hypothetical protein